TASAALQWLCPQLSHAPPARSTMHSMTRRHLLHALAALPAMSFAARADPRADNAHQADFTALEHALQGELGVAAIDGLSGRTIGHRQGQRFAMCSTFKTMAAAA